jgi:Zn-dependent protease
MEPTLLMTGITIASLVMSIVMHEVAHGYMAHSLGDPTARLAGRLTLNPLKHIDPFGSVILPTLLFLSSAGMIFGWAKPVPYNPYNLRNQKWGESLVALAGPATNVLLAVIFSVIIRVGVQSDVSPEFVDISYYIVYINILLACFNMIPVPPLDGSKVLSALLPYHLELKYRQLIGNLEQFGMMGLFAFIFVISLVLSKPLFAFVGTIVSLLTGLPFT